jgi:hypothetical protein
MKVLSLLQPWASLVLLGHKKIETRSRNTKHRGPLLIHASKSQHGYKSIDSGSFNKYFMPALCGDMPLKERQPLPFGAIIGMVNMVDTFQFSEEIINQLCEYKSEDNPWIPFREGGNNFESLEEEQEWLANIEKEIAFGDYSPGRYGYILSDPVMFDEPISAKGMLGLWSYDGPLP